MDTSINESEDNAETSRDDWELHHKHLFDDVDRYYYFSEFVDGYVDDHGLRGIRNRNAKYLKELGKASPEEKTAIIWKLVENNRPMLMREATRMYSLFPWTKEDLEDAYEDAVLLLANAYFARTDSLADYDTSKLGYLTMFTARNACNIYNTKLKRLKEAGIHDTEPFGEDTTIIPEEKILNVDQSELMDAAKLLNTRERKMFLLSIFGNTVTYGVPGELFNLEYIGELFGITRERTRQILIKSIRKLRRLDKTEGLREKIFSTDTDYEYGMERIYNKEIEKYIEIIK